MKQLIIFIILLGLFSCNKQEKRINELQNRIDNLEVKLTETYKPGFGELMGSIQSHHSKLWFAGKNKNWQLAEFEIKELNEIIDDILKYQKNRKESEKINMVMPAIKNVNHAIKQGNSKLFVDSYRQLTNACNDCHSATDFKYNLVKIPDVSPYSNQEFKIKN